MKLTKSLSVSLYAAIALGLSLLAIVLRTLNFFFFFDTELNYDAQGAILPLITNWLLILSVLFFGIASIVMFRKKIELPERVPSVAGRVGAALVALALLYCAVVDLFEGAPLYALFCIGGALYFVLLAFGQGAPLLRILSSLCATIRLLLMMTSVYFDWLIPLNAPDKLIFELACTFGMLFLVCDLRAIVDKPKSLLYGFSLATATLLCGTASIPSLITVFSMAPTSGIPTAHRLVLAALFVYAVLSLFDMVRSLLPAVQKTAEQSVPVEETTLHEENVDADQ